MCKRHHLQPAQNTPSRGNPTTIAQAARHSSLEGAGHGKMDYRDRKQWGQALGGYEHTAARLIATEVPKHEVSG
jgi:hypothetical protein